MQKDESERIEDLADSIMKQLSSLIVSKFDELLIQVQAVQKEPVLVFTNHDLKELFQISDSTLNRLLTFADFPKCWYGIRGHYAKDEILEWFEKHDYELYKLAMKNLRSE